MKNLIKMCNEVRSCHTDANKYIKTCLSREIDFWEYNKALLYSTSHLYSTQRGIIFGIDRNEYTYLKLK